MKLQDLLDRPIAYHRIFVPFAGVSGAVFLSQALYWTKRIPRESEWFYKTREDWQEETGLGRRAQEEARNTLKELGILEEKLTGIPARLFFKINFDVLESVLKMYQQGGTEELASKQPQIARTNKLVQAKQPQNEANLAVPTNTETTTYITTKEKNPSSSFLDSNSKTSIAPLTDLELWELATEMDVPLWVVKETSDNFWEYIEVPKNRKKYKTSYKTIKRWIQRGLELGKYQHNNEVEVMFLQSQHPDKLAEYKQIKEQALKEGLI